MKMITLSVISKESANNFGERYPCWKHSGKDETSLMSSVTKSFIEDVNHEFQTFHDLTMHLGETD